MKLNDPWIDSLADGATEFCLASGLPWGFVCTEPPNHDGCHRSIDFETGQVYHVWPQENLQ